METVPPPKKTRCVDGYSSQTFVEFPISAFEAVPLRRLPVALSALTSPQIPVIGGPFNQAILAKSTRPQSAVVRLFPWRMGVEPARTETC